MSLKTSKKFIFIAAIIAPFGRQQPLLGLFHLYIRFYVQTVLSSYVVWYRFINETVVGLQVYQKGAPMPPPPHVMGKT